jgi:hypothetical protein
VFSAVAQARHAVKGALQIVQIVYALQQSCQQFSQVG